MRLAFRLLVCSLCLALAAAAPATAKKKKAPKPPSRTTVKKLLKAHYLGDDPAFYPTTHFHYKVTKIVYGKRRHGTYYADGHSGTVFPVLARSSYLVCYPDNTYRCGEVDPGEVRVLPRRLPRMDVPDQGGAPTGDAPPQGEVPEVLSRESRLALDRHGHAGPDPGGEPPDRPVVQAHAAM